MLPATTCLTGTGGIFAAGPGKKCQHKRTAEQSQNSLVLMLLATTCLTGTGGIPVAGPGATCQHTRAAE
jgi:hypothetical protein